MAFAAVERLIAFRYLRARREEGFISVIASFSLVGIALGVGTLIVVMSVMNGFRIEMLRQMSAISGQLGVQGNRDGLQATPDLLTRLRAIPGVAAANPSAEGQVIAIAGERVRGVLLRGMTPEDFRARTPLAAAIEGTPAVRDRYRALCRSDDDKPIDWGTARVYEKLDGSLMTLYRYGGAWQVASSGLPDGSTLALGRRMTYPSNGMKVIETRRDATSAQVITTGRAKMKCPTSPCISRKGR